MLDGSYEGILDGRRLRDRRQRFAGRVRHEMKMKEARLAVGHLWRSILVSGAGLEGGARGVQLPTSLSTEILHSANCELFFSQKSLQRA